MATSSFIDNIIIEEKDLLSAVEKAKKTSNKLNSIHVDSKDVTSKEEIEKIFKKFSKSMYKKLIVWYIIIIKSKEKVWGNYKWVNFY